MRAGMVIDVGIRGHWRGEYQDDFGIGISLRFSGKTAYHGMTQRSIRNGLDLARTCFEMSRHGPRWYDFMSDFVDTTVK
jgi:hypothetical protein